MVWTECPGCLAVWISRVFLSLLVSVCYITLQDVSSELLPSPSVVSLLPSAGVYARLSVVACTFSPHLGHNVVVLHSRLVSQAL